MAAPLRTKAFHADPFPVYKVLRDESPVFHDLERDTYVLTRHADVAKAARDHDRFSSRDTKANIPDRMTRMDPPRHDHWRKLTSRRFHPRTVARTERRLRELTRRILDEISEEPAVDIVSEFAAPIPSTIIGDLIGVPREYNARFRKLSELSIAGAPDVADAANREISGVFETLIEARRREPENDILSDLVAGLVDGRPLSHQELLGYCLHLVVAGNDTTANLIATGVHLFATHPEARRALVSNPSLIPAAIEELLRYDGPVQMLARTTTAAVTLHGVTLPAHSPVELYWGAANRDERQFRDPDVFDITRKDRGHLAFGHGIHFCLGAHLARLEARIAFEELLARAPDYRLTDSRELRFKPGWSIRGFEALRVELRVQ